MKKPLFEQVKLYHYFDILLWLKGEDAKFAAWFKDYLEAGFSNSLQTFPDIKVVDVNEEYYFNKEDPHWVRSKIQWLEEQLGDLENSRIILD